MREMDEIKIHYQIEQSDSAEASALLAATKYKGFWLEVTLFLGSALLLAFLPLTYKVPETDWQYPYLVVPFACFQMYYAALYLLPRLNARRAYKFSGLAGRTFDGTFSEGGLRVEAPGVTWESKWSAFQLVKETRLIFLFYDGYTMFILAKRYFTADQLPALQELIKERWRPESPSNK